MSGLTGPHVITHAAPLLLHRFDKFNSLRATTVKLGDNWSKTFQRGLLSNPETTGLNKQGQRDERSRAFDLLDALSKSGALTLNGCTLHVVLAATHTFDLDLLNTVVQVRTQRQHLLVQFACV